MLRRVNNLQTPDQPTRFLGRKGFVVGRSSQASRGRCAMAKSRERKPPPRGAASRTSTKRVSAAAKQVQALQLREAGVPYEKIAETLGYHHRSRHGRVESGAVGTRERATASRASSPKHHATEEVTYPTQPGPGGGSAQDVTRITPESNLGIQPVAHGDEVPPALANHPRYRILELLGAGGMGAVYEGDGGSKCARESQLMLFQGPQRYPSG
jgi:hypothetical protein